MNNARRNIFHTSDPVIRPYMVQKSSFGRFSEGGFCRVLFPIPCLGHVWGLMLGSCSKQCTRHRPGPLGGGPAKPKGGGGGGATLFDDDDDLPAPKRSAPKPKPKASSGQGCGFR